VKKTIKKWAAPVLCGLLALILFRFVFFVGYVPTASMEPVISAGSVIFGFRVTGEIRRGDILVFNHSGNTLVKRVAAVAGDVVHMNEDNTLVLVNEYMPNAFRTIIVPEGSFFMLGDNAEESVDSRVWEIPFISEEQIVAKVWGR
jgi:signal peptidase I